MSTNQLLGSVQQINTSGRHCAETLSEAIIRHFDPAAQYDARVATAFGAGIGNTMQDLCGMFTGGLIAIGWLHGRTEPGTDWSGCAKIAAAWRDRFEQRFGSRQCPVLLKGFGEQDNMDKCRALGGDAALLLAEILEQAR